MKTNSKRLCRMVLLSALPIAMVGDVYADGYRNPPPTAEGLGKSSAHSAFVDDASAIFYNPANLAMQEDHSLVLAATFAQSEITYEPAPGYELKSDDPWNVLPNLFYSQPVGVKGLVVGLGISTPYGQSVSWNKTDLVNPMTGVTEPVPYEAEVLLVNFNPTASFKLHDSVYFGIGGDIFYSDFSMKALFPNLYPVADPMSPYDVEGSGDGWGIGGNVGLTWLPTENQRVALTYRSRVDVKYKGDFAASYPNTGEFETTLKYPNTIGIGYGIALPGNVQLEALFEWLEWSVNKTQTINAGGSQLVLENNWDDSYSINTGVNWEIIDGLAVRSGYTWLPSPIPDSSASPLLPDLDRHILSFGIGYSLGMHTLDLGYAYSIYDDRETANGTYDVDSNLASVTYSLSF